MATASYPSNIINFGPDKQNTVDLIIANDPNTLRAEVVAIESTIGTTPALSTAASSSSTWYNDGRDYSSITSRLANIEIGIVADTHTQYVKRVGGSTITPASSSTVGLTIAATSGQTADLQEWKDEAGNVVTYIDAAGILYASGAVVGGSTIGDYTPTFFLGGI